MRRLIAIPLIAALLAPWIATLSGATVPVVPCPMHRSSGATAHGDTNATARTHHQNAQHDADSHHGNSARGCNCPGECGRSGAAFGLPERGLIRELSPAIAHAVLANEPSDFACAPRLLPLATGPPQRLRI